MILSARAVDRAGRRLARLVGGLLAAAPLPAALRLPGTAVLPTPAPLPGRGRRAVRLPFTRRRRRRSLLRRAASVAAPGVALGAGYVVVVRRPSGGDVVARMSHREAGPPTDLPGAGDLPPVVLVHGLGMSSRSLQGLVRGLGQEVRALAPDLPGYGRSPQPRTGVLDVEQLADAVIAWLRRHELGPVVLVGHSFGAQVAGEVVLRAPELVLRLVAIAPTGDPDRSSVAGLAARLARDVLRERATQWPVAGWDYLRAGPGQMVALLRRALPLARRQLDAPPDVPVLVVRGERDPVCRQGWCERMAASAADGRCAVVPGAHGVAFDAPPELVRLVLEEVRAAAAAAPAPGEPAGGGPRPRP